FDLLEAGERVADPLVVELGADLEPRRRALLARDDRLLARLGVLELRLELLDVLVLLLKRFLDLGELALGALQAFADARLGEERRLGEILALLEERELGLPLPLALLAPQRLDAPLELLLLGDGAHGGRAHLDERILHLLDDEAADLL